ncbi:sigma factor SigB/phosphatase RsbP regulator RsbQ [soil metagenome]
MAGNPLSRNNVQVMGKGNQPMIFGHGFGCDQKMWRYLIPAFQEDYKIVLLDYVGTGNSDISCFDPVKYGCLRGYTQDILEICDRLELANAIFVGHSVGAIIGILAAIKEPERFDKLVLIGPSPCYLNKEDYVGGFSREEIESLLAFMEQDYVSWANTFSQFIMGNPDNPLLSDFLFSSFCSIDPAIAKHFARVTFLSDNRADLPKVEVPALVLQCSEDLVAPVEVGQYVHKNLKQSHFIQLEATGHCPHLSAPAETVAAMKAFL